MTVMRSPFPRYGKSGLAALLASAIVVGGKYAWQKWRPKKKTTYTASNGGFGPKYGPTGNRQKKENGMGASSDLSHFEEPYPFGSMESVSGQNISLKSVSLNGRIDGLLFSSTITQEYKNETEDALEIIYTFPLGWNTALLGMDATIGGKRLHGEVVKNAEAEEHYEEAIEKGDSAIMVQKSTQGLYTASLGNIRPGETVTVAIHCARLLNYEQGRIRIAIPTVIGERYGDPYCSGGLASHESARVDKTASYSFNLDLIIHGDISEDMIECPSHKILVTKGAGGIAVRLGVAAQLDRDFVLLIRSCAGESGSLCVADQDKWLAAASFCPHMPNVEDNPLGLKILVDCSGSMDGMSIQQAQKGLQKILKLLTPRDYVSYSRFGSDVEHLSSAMLACDEANMRKLVAALENIEADMGGTEMEKAVLSTIGDVSQNGDVPPVLLLITDGDIWESQSLIESAKKRGHRIFVIGVGAAPAESVLMELAGQTGGKCEFVTPNENMAEAIVRMFHRMRGKAAKNIRIDWPEKPLWQSALPAHIYDGETVHAFALLDKKPVAGPTLSWQAGNEVFSVSIATVQETTDPALGRLGRKCQMEESISETEKLEIALKYQLVSALTSLILVYERPEEEKMSGLPKIQQVPQMPAYGHGNYFSGVLMGLTGECLYISDSFSCAATDDIIDHSIWDHESWDNEINALISFWKAQVMQINSLAEFISMVRRQKKFSSLVSVVDAISAETGFCEEGVWANFMAHILEEAGKMERYDKRLLGPLLYTGDEKRKFEEALANSL